MKRPHFLCITPYEGMREIFRNIAAIETGFTCTVLLGDYELGVEIARENFTDDVDAIISRGETAQLLADAFSVPIFKIKFSSYDILRALKAAQSISPRFVLVGRPSVTKIGQTLCDLLQYTEVRIESIQSVEETEEILRRARQDGYSLVVGDMRTVNYAQLLNMQSILIISGVETIEDTLNHAVQTITCMNAYAEQNALLKNAFLCSDAPAAILNPEGGVVFSALDAVCGALLSGVLKSDPDLLERDDVELVKKRDGVYYTVHGRRLVSGGQTYQLFQVAARAGCPASGAVSIYNRGDFSDGSCHLFWGHSPRISEFLDVARRSARIPAPLLIVSEYGCEADRLAANLYLQGPFQDRPLFSVDCARLSGGKLRELFESSASPLYDVGHMLYFQNVDALTGEQATELLSGLEDARTTSRQKVVLSFQTNSPGPLEQFRSGNRSQLSAYMTLCIPPLREHAEDIWEISNLYINSLNLEYGKQIVGIQPEAALQLERFPWPQNLTQLKQTLRSAMVAADSSYISSKNLSFILNSVAATGDLGAGGDSAGIDFSRPLHEIEYQIASHVLRMENNNQTHAARRLGISRSTLWRILKNPV